MIIQRATLSAEQMQKIRALSKPTVFPWLVDVALDCGIVILAFLLIARGYSANLHMYQQALLDLFAILTIGNRQHALAILGHEGSHYTVSKNKALNDLLANLFCFWPLLITVVGYRALHVLHHQHTGNENDPELAHKMARAPQWDLPFKKGKVLRYMALDLVGYSIPDLLIILTFAKPKNIILLAPVVCLHLCAWAVTFYFGCIWVPLVWYFSLATTFMMFFRLRIWLEHQGTSGTHKLALNPLQAALLAPHKIWLHLEHHNFPAVPYSRLKEARTICGDEVKSITLSELIQNLETTPYHPSGLPLNSSVN